MHLNESNGRSSRPFNHVTGFSQHAGGCGKPQRLSQATTNPADRQIADRPVVAAQGNGTTHDR
jgi:hypothetical protein